MANLFDRIINFGAKLDWISPLAEIAADAATNGEIIAVTHLTPDEAKARLKNAGIPCNYASYTTDPDDFTLYVSVPGKHLRSAKRVLWS